MDILIKQRRSVAKEEVDDGHVFAARVKRQLVPAIFSTAALMLYCAIGAYVIREIEYEYGVNRTSKDDMVRQLAAKLCSRKVLLLNESCESSKVAQLEQMIYTYRNEVLTQVVSSGVTKREPMWTFVKSAFYCWTLITTVGYGHYAPTSIPGRVFTMFFSILGMPLLILNATKLGTLFTSSLCQLKTSLVSLRLRLTIRYRCRLKRKQLQNQKRVNDDKQALVTNNNFTALDPNAQFRLLSDRLAQLVKSGQEMRVETPDSMMPAWIAWFAVPGYLILISLIFFFIESWSFFDSFYFTFVTFTSIGFGDIVPTKEGEVLAFSVFVFLGIGLFASLTEFAELRLVRWSHRAKHYLEEEFTPMIDEVHDCTYCNPRYA